MIYYIYREQEYKSLLPLNEGNIFENVPLVVVKMKSGTMKVVNLKFPQQSYKSILSLNKESIFENII